MDPKPIRGIKDRTKELTDRRRTPVPMPYIVAALKRKLRGWSSHSNHRNCTGVMSTVKMHLEERVRTHLRRRHKLISWAQAYHRFPGHVLYQAAWIRHRLQSMPLP
jgi:hypothetical protein